jgi:hypothetical protein
LILPVALVLAVTLIVPTTALSASGTTGYGQTPPPPTTPTTPKTPTTPTPSAGTSPSKEKSTPAKETGAPTSTVGANTATATTNTAKASTLPFTGLDLRWTMGIGLLLIGTGLSVMMVQRRHRRDSSR